jgi:predicted histone-like DNA-binding protein
MDKTMALQIRVQKMKRKGQPDKWYGKAVKWQDVSLATIAEKISMDNSVTESDVYAVLKALVYEMKKQLQMGNTVKLDGFGSFHLTIESDTVDNKEDYKLDEHVKRVVCKFTPTGHRRSGKLNYYFCEGVKLKKVKR